MIRSFIRLNLLAVLLLAISCNSSEPGLSADELLGSAQYQAIAYGGFRNHNRSKAPTVEEIKEDVKLMHAMDIRFLRTYHARLYNHAANLLQAIAEIKAEDPDFEMYVMLGCWMQCEGAFTNSPNHAIGDSINNSAEIEEAIALASAYPDIVKVVAAGNESMVHWAATYYVQPPVITRWVKHLQEQKRTGVLPENLWITSSDNYASWGGEAEYQGPELEELIEAVDYISLHSYPFHDTHYNPEFWYVPAEEENLDKKIIINNAMERAVDRVEQQVKQVQTYVNSLGSEKEIHIGETGWASDDNSLYGASGSKAADEYKQHLYYQKIRSWCDSMRMSCFYFEAFDEPWKDQNNLLGSENHFGLFDVEGNAKLPIHAELEANTFKDLGRNGITPDISTQPEAVLFQEALVPPFKSAVPVKLLEYPNNHQEGNAQVLQLLPIAETEKVSYPSESLKINAWDGTCNAYADSSHKVLNVLPGNGPWWGAALEVQGASSDLSAFEKGSLQFEIRTNSTAQFELGFLTGNYSKGNQKRAAVKFGQGQNLQASKQWKTISTPLSQLKGEDVDLKDVSALLFLSGENAAQGDTIQLRNISYVK